MTKNTISNIILEELLRESVKFAEQLWSQVKERALKKTGSPENVEYYFEDKILQSFIKGDPTHNKKYVTWMINQYAKKWLESSGSRTENMSNIIEAVEKFFELAKEKVIADINIFNYKTLEQIKDVIDSSEGKLKHKRLAAAPDFLAQRKQTPVETDEPRVYETDSYYIVCPRNYEESKENTSEEDRWCVGYDEEHWNRYVAESNYTIYYIHITDETVANALGLIFEEYGVDDTPESTAHMCISVNSNDKFTEIKDVFNRDFMPHFKEYMEILKIPRKIFVESNDIDREGSNPEMDEDTIWEKERDAIEEHKKDIINSIYNIASEYEKDSTPSDIDEKIYEWFEENVDHSLMDIETEWPEGYGVEDGYCTASSGIYDLLRGRRSYDSSERSYDPEAIDLIKSALYALYELDDDLVPEWEETHKKRPYIDADQYPQQELFERTYRKTLKILLERKVITKK